MLRVSFVLNCYATLWDECKPPCPDRERIILLAMSSYVPHIVFWLCVLVPTLSSRPDAALAQERGRASLSMQTSAQEPHLCFSAQSLRDHVNAQLGYDAFLDEAEASRPPLSIVVLVSRDESGALLQATLMTSRPGEAERTRMLSSSQCNDLLDAIVFSLTLVIDPLRATSGEQHTAVDQASRLLHVATTRATTRASVVKGSSTIHRAIKLARWGARPAAVSAPSNAPERAGDALPTSEALVNEAPPSDTSPPPRPSGGSDVVSASSEAAAPKRAASATLKVREVLLGSSVRRGALPSADVQLGLGLRSRRGRGALEVSWLAGVPNRYRALDGVVSLSAHHLDVAGCGVLSREEGALRPYLLPCARLRAGVFLGSGEGYDASFDAARWLLAPGLSLHGGVGLGKPGWFIQGDLFGGWMAARTRYIVQGEEVARSLPYMLSAGVSLVFRLPAR